jgi:hypothetical protein
VRRHLEAPALRPPASDVPLAEPPAPSSPPSSDVPRAETPPARPLFQAPGLGPSDRIADVPHGHTLYPDDPSLRPEAVRAEAEKRVGQRVQGWAAEGLAEARALKGLPHPYFSRVRDAVRSGLDKLARETNTHPSSGQILKSWGKRYGDAAESFAKSGDPNLGPPGINPRPSERMKERFSNEAPFLSALAQATETQDDLTHGKPLISLTVELREFRDGSPFELVLLQGSADSRFDDFVLSAWPKSIAEAGPPPLDAFHGPQLRSIWSIEGWLRLPKVLDDVFAYAPVPGAFGIGADRVLPAFTDEGYRYEFHATVLRVY